MPAGHSRMDRVNELIRQQIGEIVTTELRDPRIGFVTVTESRTSPDLRHARVFISVYGGEDERRACLEGLTSAASFIRGELGRRICLRNVPELVFVMDESAERAQRLETLFQDLHLDDDTAT